MDLADTLVLETSAVRREGSTPSGSTMARQKKYGPKMANPRIRRSKERRGCGPLGRYIKYQKGEFVSVLPWSRAKNMSLSSRGQGLNPLKVETGVQIPKETLIDYFVYRKDT